MSKNLKKKELVQKERIPFNTWINSQLSVCKYTNGCIIRGKEYRLDWDNARTEIGEDGELLYFPDLVEQ